jgi:elongation factor 2 kinase
VQIDESQPFAEGAMRKCFRMKKMTSHLSKEAVQNQSASTQWKYQHNYVAKRYKTSQGLSLQVEIEVMERDVEMQIVAKQLAAAYNSRNPSKSVDMLDTYMVQVLTREPNLMQFCFGMFRRL